MPCFTSSQEQGVGEEHLPPYKAAIRKVAREIKARPQDNVAPPPPGVAPGSGTGVVRMLAGTVALMIAPWLLTEQSLFASRR